MSDFYPSSSPFLRKVIAAIDENLSDEHFGVAELSEQIGMSRSNLLRKVKQETNASVSVLIREVRLHRAKDMLQETELTVSEISYKVGFSSTSYFTKCYRELFGHTPGTSKELRLAPEQDVLDVASTSIKPSKSKTIPLAVGLLVLIALGASYFYFKKQEPVKKSKPKTIAVLPFKNDSSDSTNIYLMNGLMEAVLSNFQKVRDIRVTSRTTVEKYRGQTKTIPELSQELDVNYFVEGSGQKIGKEILLTVQLIEASTDNQLWSRRYKRELKDIFQLQMDIAQSIAAEINAVITPAEKARIEKKPTQNLVAYEYYLKAREQLDKQENPEVVREAVVNFKKAIAEDGEFAEAYAYVAIAYYYLDVFQAEKEHRDELKKYAEKAMLIDDKLGESLIAMALYYLQNEEYELAVSTFEEVLSYYPNASWVHNTLTDIYTSRIPNTKKYLSHAIRGIQYAVADEDSVTASYSYLHLGNALAQTGFINEAEKYIHKSLAYYQHNIFSKYLLVYLHLAQNSDFEAARESLFEILAKDSTRIDVIQEIAKLSYTMDDYETSWVYYEKMLAIKADLKLDIYKNTTGNIAFVLAQLGKQEFSAQYLDSFLAYAENDESIYKPLSLSAYYASTGNTEEGIRYLKAFSKEDDYQYWFVLFLDKDPIIRQLSSHPEFEAVIDQIADKFWKNHQDIRKMLEEENVI